MGFFHAYLKDLFTVTHSISWSQKSTFFNTDAVG